jgi:hypothetical protein
MIEVNLIGRFSVSDRYPFQVDMLETILTVRKCLWVGWTLPYAVSGAC